MSAFISRATAGFNNTVNRIRNQGTAKAIKSTTTARQRYDGKQVAVRVDYSARAKLKALGEKVGDDLTALFPKKLQSTLARALHNGYEPIFGLDNLK